MKNLNDENLTNLTPEELESVSGGRNGSIPDIVYCPICKCQHHCIALGKDGCGMEYLCTETNKSFII